VSPARVPGTPDWCPRDGSSLPHDHAAAIDGVDPPSSVCHLWLPKPLDRPFCSPSVPAPRTKGRRASKKLRFQVIANTLTDGWKVGWCSSCSRPLYSITVPPAEIVSDKAG
jgi:hypothetical protein